jgi:aldehyde dehydrogenase (NAD+)
MYINGEWVSSDSGETFDDLNPATEESIGKFQKGNEKDINKAVDAAEDAFELWSETPAPKRGKIILKAAQLLEQNKESLARELTEEMGKILVEARGDVQEAIDTAEYMAGEGRRLLGFTTTSELKDKFAMTIKRPIGIVGLITPWNFPIAIPSWKIFPALVCGNTIVFKPSSDTPRCAIRFVEILEKAGVPKGVINLVTGPGGSTGLALAKHKKVRAISFTGHKDTGAEILKQAGIKKVGLELGGKNGIIIMDDADLKLALDGVVWGGYGTTGQRCTAASRVIIHEKVFKTFEKMLVERVKKLKLGNGLKSNIDIGPLINKAAQEKSKSYVDIGLKEGTKLLTGGEIPKMKGFFFEPTLFSNCSIDMRIAQEEIFGPVVCLISVKNLQEAIDAMNSVEYGLSSSIYTNNIRNAFKAIEKIEAGITYVNSSTIGAEIHLPFGGIKHSGTTREGGMEGINEFSETKTVYIDYSGKLQKAQIDS